MDFSYLKILTLKDENHRFSNWVSEAADHLAKSFVTLEASY